MIPRDSAWSRLTKAARQAPETPVEAAPFGFSTRVVSLAMSDGSRRNSWQGAFVRSAWRGLGIALMLMFLSIAANFSSLSSAAENEQDSVIDPVGEVLASL